MEAFGETTWPDDSLLLVRRFECSASNDGVERGDKKVLNDGGHCIGGARGSRFEASLMHSKEGGRSFGKVVHPGDEASTGGEMNSRCQAGSVAERERCSELV